MSFIEPPFWWNPTRPRAAHVVRMLVTPPSVEPLTLDECKLRAGALDWPPGDAREAQLAGYLATARSKVETDSEMALLTQTWAFYFDAFPCCTLTLPALSQPLQSVVLSTTDAAGVVTPVDAATYDLDAGGGRLSLATGAAWPTGLRRFQPYRLDVVSGYETAAALKASHPVLVHLVGLLTAHYQTLGRDLASIDSATEVPFGYEDLIAPYRRVSLF